MDKFGKISCLLIVMLAICAAFLINERFSKDTPLKIDDNSYLCTVTEIRDDTSWNERNGIVVDCSGKRIGFHVYNSLQHYVGQQVYVKKTRLEGYVAIPYNE